MRPLRWLLFTSCLFIPTSFAAAQECSPDSLGTSRTLEVPFAQGPVGRTNYRHTLPLAPGEVVLTFDDGPMPRRTPAVLDALRAECVKATFFVVGTMVAAYPDVLRRTAAEGHTIATHTWSHAYLDKTRSEVVQRDQISGGLLAARAVLGDDNPRLSSFFRYPGLGHTQALDRYVDRQHLIPFSIDVDGEDWKRITPAQIIDRVMGQLDTLGRGIILLHDIQARTVAILPELLRQLKVNGYRVVHITGATEDTRQALNASETPRSERMQIALGRLNQQQAVHLATREAERDPSSRLAAAADSQNHVGRAKRVQFASAGFDGPSLTAPAAWNDTEALKPTLLRGSLDLLMIPTPSTSEPILSVANGKGRGGPLDLRTGSTVAISIGSVHSPSITKHSKQPSPSIPRRVQSETPSPTAMPLVSQSATWVDLPVRIAALPKVPSTNSLTKTEADVAFESRFSNPARGVSFAPAAAPSLEATTTASASKSVPVKVATLQPQLRRFPDQPGIPEPEVAQTVTQGPAFVSSSATKSAAPSSVAADAALTTASFSVPSTIKRFPSALRADRAPRPTPASPITKAEPVLVVSQALTSLPITRPAHDEATSSATGQRHGGFVVLAVASGAGPSFQDVTMRR